MKTFIVKTLGCKVNQCESEGIARTLIESGLEPVDGDLDAADIVIINTCTITAKAGMQSRQAVRQAIRAYPEARIVVTGCHAQIAPGELHDIDGVDWVVGNGDKHKIPEMLRDTASLPLMADESLHDRTDIALVDRFQGPPGIAHGSRTRPFLKIQDGCNAFCTYCIVPHARGRSRSMSQDQVIAQVGQLGRLGYREVVLTGIHLGCYGHDLHPTTDLYSLLCRIRDAGAVERIRISSIEPAELSDEIIDLAASGNTERGRLCRHFHIPLQSGDDGILERMHRPYGRDYFKALVLRILERVPDAAIGVDTLIGFPGESETAFQNTYALIEVLPVSYLHVFPFSPRNGTPAFSFKDQVPFPEVKQRCQRMRELGAKKRMAFYERFVGKAVDVLVEGTRDRNDLRLKGLTDNYIPVKIEGPDAYYNTRRKIRITAISGDGSTEGVVC